MTCAPIPHADRRRARARCAIRVAGPLLVIGCTLVPVTPAPAQTAPGATAPAGGSAAAPRPESSGLVDAARGPVAIPAETTPPRLGNWVNDDVRRARGWPQQPPVIPHRVDGYQIDRNFNKCLDCHAREKTAFSQAVPVSETHFVDRAGKRLDRISTRRYFCMQCHVAQEAAAPLVANTFAGAAAPAGPAASRPAAVPRPAAPAAAAAKNR